MRGGPDGHFARRAARFATADRREWLIKAPPVDPNWSAPGSEAPSKHADYITAVNLKFSPCGGYIDPAIPFDSTTAQMANCSSTFSTESVRLTTRRLYGVASHAGKIKSFHVSDSLRHLSWTEWNIQANNQPASIALAYNGKFVASALSRYVPFWDTSTHAPIGPIIECSGRVWSIALSKDGYLASGGLGDDKNILLRDLRDILQQFYFLDPTPKHYCRAGSFNGTFLGRFPRFVR